MPLSILKQIADNPALFEALKEVILKHFSLKDLEVEGLKNPNEVLGQLTRSRLEGLQKLDAAFKEIELQKTPKAIPHPINRAR
jgi:hypothetical protein